MGRLEASYDRCGVTQGSFGGSFRNGVCCGLKASCAIDGVAWEYSRGGGEGTHEAEEDEKKGVCCGLRRTRHRNKRRSRAGTRKRMKRNKSDEEKDETNACVAGLRLLACLMRSRGSYFGGLKV